MIYELPEGLAEHCEAVFTEIVNGVVFKLTQLFSVREVPNEYNKSDNFLYYLGDTLDSLNPRKRFFHPLYQETRDFIKKEVDQLTEADLFVVRCYYMVFLGKDIVGEERKNLARSIMDVWSGNLSDVKITIERKEGACRRTS